jgi:hypothetical protein
VSQRAGKLPTGVFGSLSFYASLHERKKDMKMLKNLLTMAVVLGLGSVVTVANADEGDGGQKLSRDQLRMAAQGICPVSGNELGTHGEFVKVKVGEETIFLCCKGCTSGKINPEHWATIHANFAKAQGICPVMKHKLPESPKWTIVQGQIIYVCCPPCLKKIEADPDTYVKAVDELYLASLKKQKKD